MRIRQYSSPDRARIHDILAGSGTFTREEIVVALEVIDEAESHPDLGDYTVLCAEDDSGELIGYICFGPVPMTDRCYDLYWICVDRQTRRSGVGSALISGMESELRERKARHVYIDTSSTAPYGDARIFYEKHGYRPVSVLSEFYRQGDDKIIFRKIF